ncbi:MAG: glycosyltransferase family 9 protein, partial [Chitinivibrionales bacterium]
QEGFCLGDMIMLSTTLKELRRYYSEARIDLVTSPQGAVFLRGTEHIDGFIVIEGPPWARRFKKGFLSRIRYYIRGIGDIKEGSYDLAIDFRGDIAGLLLFFLAGVPKRIAYNDFSGGFLSSESYTTPPDCSHQFLRNLYLTSMITGSDITETCKRPFYPVSGIRDRKRVESVHGIEISGKRVVVHPYTIREHKTLSFMKWDSVIDSLIESGYRAVVTAGPEEGWVSDHLLSLKTHRIPFIQPDFRDIPGLLSGAAGVLSCDTFMAHAAWSLGLPCVVVFGPTNPGYYAPLSERTSVVWNNRILWPPYKEWHAGVSAEDNTPEVINSAVYQTIRG